MKHRKALIGLTLFLVISTVATWLVFVTLRREVRGSTNSYSAIFTDVSGLKAGDDVRVAGVRVGRVESVDLDGVSAKVTFRVERRQTLYDDTIATVTYQNIIGQRYVGLMPGHAEHHRILPDRGRIPLERTRPSFDISNLLNGFEPLFTLLNPQQVDNLTEGIIQALQGDSSSVLALITQTSSLAETLAGPDAILGELITNLDEVAAIVARQDANLKAVIGQSHDALVTLSDRRNQLVASTGSIDRSVERLAVIADAVYPQLRELIARQPGLLGQFTGDGRQRLAVFGSNLPLVLKGIARATQEGSYVNGYICDINSTIFAFLSRVIPAITRLASPGNVTEHSPICQ